MRTDPQPSARLIGRYYPDDYGPFATQQQRATSRLQRSLAALVEAPYRLRYDSPRPVPEPPHCGARALDIGVGSGDFLKRLAARGWEPWGIEANPSAAEAARQRCGLASGRIVVARAEDVSFAHGTFDLITAHHVVEHLHDPMGVLSKAQTWLSDDGRLVLTMPNVKSLESRLFGRLWFGLDLPRHLYHFDPDTITELLGRSGFEAIDVVPEYDAASWGDSAAQAARALFASRRKFQRSFVLSYALLPWGALVHGLGGGSSMLVSARKGARTSAAPLQGRRRKRVRRARRDRDTQIIHPPISH
ncbi:MAG: class I SAM-dependent methyltransferase [Actinobacteria bacterium]|nr:class I SAM-dependent methyltransferase [Actinomycetota bacterium]